MCRAAKCRVCGKTTWAGCGMHVDVVKRSVPSGQWCDGHAAEAAVAPKRSWFRRKSNV